MMLSTLDAALDGYVTADEAAAALGISKNTWRGRVHRGRAEVRRVGRSVLVPLSWLERQPGFDADRLRRAKSRRRP